MSSSDFSAVDQATDYLSNRLDNWRPSGLVVLGSGLQDFASERVVARAVIPYADIPGFPVSTAPGHRGRLVCGECGGRPVAVMQGRVHLYEGWQPREVVFPIRVAARWGARWVVQTNAAGGIHPSLRPGDAMLLSDHINFLGSNPLTGPDTPARGPRFPDLSEAYDGHWRERFRTAVAREKLAVREGVYLANPGPSFETPAEIRAYTALGADAVGMSTVLETIAARHNGLKVLALSCISNLAAGRSAEPLSQEEVEATTAAVRPYFLKLIELAVHTALEQ